MSRITGCLLAGVLAMAVVVPAFANTEKGVKKWQAKDYAGAVAEWRGPAEAGNRDAQFNLGQAYKLGRGVPADPKKAIELYRKAAAQGHETAEANLGWVLFQQGQREEALPILQRAANRGDPHSQYLLGIAFFNGDVVLKDWPRAYRLMTASAKSGLPQAKDALSQMDARIPLAERQKALATPDTPLPIVVDTQIKPVPITSSTKSPTSTAARPSSTAPSQIAPPQVAAAAPVRQITLPDQPQEQTDKSPAGKWRVQLGAFNSRNAAVTAWSGLSRKVGDLSEFNPTYVANGPMVRLQAGPLADRASATSLCAKITATGAGCFPVQF